MPTRILLRSTSTIITVTASGPEPMMIFSPILRVRTNTGAPFGRAGRTTTSSGHAFRLQHGQQVTQRADHDDARPRRGRPVGPRPLAGPQPAGRRFQLEEDRPALVQDHDVGGAGSPQVD